MSFKETVYKHYFEILFERGLFLENSLAELKEMGANESKSTAGDKHETSLAMIQIQQDQLRNQLVEVKLQRDIYEKIDIGIQSKNVIQGSLMRTNHGFFFLSIALGKAKIDEIDIVSLSIQSPLGLILKGLEVGNTAVLNGRQYIIEVIL